MTDANYDIQLNLHTAHTIPTQQGLSGLLVGFVIGRVHKSGTTLLDVGPPRPRSLGAAYDLENVKASHLIRAHHALDGADYLRQILFRQLRRGP